MSLEEQALLFLKEDRVKLGTVSGVLTTTANLIEWVDNNIPEIELITTKSYQVRPNPGNREPILVEQDIGCYENAVGLRNPGLEKGYRELAELRREHPLRALLNVSLSADCIDDFVLLADSFAEVADLLELNFSCPHARGRYGEAIGSNPRVVAEFIREIRASTTALLFSKLSPNVENIGGIAFAALKAGADGISAINTVGPVVFREAHTGSPVLYNPLGHKGGKSGEWIRQVALEKIKEVREAAGPGIPIIGMGGISRGEDVLRMREAGADVIGIGSALIRVPGQAEIPRYIHLLKKDTEYRSNAASGLQAKERLLEYKPHTILHTEEVSEDLKIFYLSGEIDYRASQFAFLFIPGVGEKPFSIAGNDPLTFIIRKKGEFSRAAFALSPGDMLLIRGVYGADSPDSRKNRARVVAGGTGIAVAPRLAQKLAGQGKEVTVYYGAASREELGSAGLIGKYARVVPVADNGKPGRVLEVMKEVLIEEEITASCFYNIGPAQFMEKAADLEEALGADPEDIFCSLERETRCGVGACGSCECGGRLLCKEGTFVRLSFLRSKHQNLGNRLISHLVHLHTACKVPTEF